MNDKDESRDEKDFWGSVSTPNPGREADKTGWGERKEPLTPARYDWGNGGGARRDAPKVAADSECSDTPVSLSVAMPVSQDAATLVSRNVVSEVPRELPRDVVIEPVRDETQNTTVDSSPLPALLLSSNHSPVLIAGIIGGIVLLLVLVVSMGRRGSDTSAAVTNTYATTAKATTTAFVNTKELNVRVGPGSEHSLVTKLAHGDQLTRLGEGQSADGGQWVRVRFGSTEGWVNKKLISDNKPPPLIEETPSDSNATGGGFDSMVISMGSIGGMHVVGMTVSEAAKALGVRLIREGKESEGCFYVKPEGSEEGLRFMVNEGKIARFDINDNKVQYEGGISIGDSEAKLRSMFGNRLVVEPDAYDEQGKYYKLTQGKFGVVFETYEKRVTNIRSGRAPEFEYIEGCS